VKSAVFSPDGSRLFTAGADGTIRTWETSLGRLEGDPKRWRTAPARELLPHRGHTASVSALAFSSDGARVLTHGQDQTVRRWDAVTGKELSVCAVPPDANSNQQANVVFLPDGRSMILASADGSLRRCEAEKGAEQRSGKVAGPYPDHLALSPNGRLLALASAFSHRISLHDAATLTELRRWPAHHDGMTGLAFTAAGRLLISRSHDNTTRLWNVADGAEVAELDEPTTACSPDGRYAVVHKLVNSRPSDQYALVDLNTGHTRGTLRSEAGDSRQLMSPHGWYLAIAVRNSILVHEMASGQKIAHFTSDPGFINGLRFSPDGRTLATGLANGTTLLWDLTRFRSDPTLPAQKHTPEQLKDLWEELGGLDAAAANRALWSLVSSRETVAFLRDWLRPAERDEAANGDTFSSAPHVLRGLRAVHALEQLARVPGSTADSKQQGRQATELLQKLAGGTEQARQTRAARQALERMQPPADVTVAKVNTSRPAEPRKTPATVLRKLGQAQFRSNGYLSSVAFSPDAKILAFISDNNSIHLWDAATGKEMRRLSAPVHVSSCLAFSPDGKVLAVTCFDSAVRRWDMASGKELGPLGGHQGIISGIAFSPDGKLLVSGGWDNIRIWNTDTGKQVRELRGHGRGSVALSVSPDN
jgi:WD40 repeat protein